MPGQSGSGASNGAYAWVDPPPCLPHVAYSNAMDVSQAYAPGGTAQVRPVTVGQPVPVLPSLNVMLGPVGAAMVKDLSKPVLTPGKDNDFLVRFPIYPASLAAGQGTLLDDVKVSMLETSLPSGAKVTCSAGDKCPSTEGTPHDVPIFVELGRPTVW